MNIVETNLKFGSLSTRKSTRRAILHHAAAKTCDAKTIHGWHKNNGWAGIGYHFVVRKDGTIEEGRPIHTVGAHATGQNFDSIGVCFEGNFEVETMGEAQKQAGKDLIAWLKATYSLGKIQRHKDVGSTACPGANFPFEEIAGVAPAKSESAVSKPAASSGQDEWVGRLQAECNAQGFSKQKVDKIPGPITLAGCPTLYKGSRGNITKLVQERLNDLGYRCGAEDGINGDNTQDGIKAFQRAYGLTADGIVGVNTWRKLIYA